MSLYDTSSILTLSNVSNTIRNKSERDLIKRINSQRKISSDMKSNSTIFRYFRTKNDSSSDGTELSVDEQRITDGSDASNFVQSDARVENISIGDGVSISKTLNISTESLCTVIQKSEQQTDTYLNSTVKNEGSTCSAESINRRVTGSDQGLEPDLSETSTKPICSIFMKNFKKRSKEVPTETLCDGEGGESQCIKLKTVVCGVTYSSMEEIKFPPEKVDIPPIPDLPVAEVISLDEKRDKPVCSIFLRPQKPNSQKQDSTETITTNVVNSIPKDKRGRKAKDETACTASIQGVTMGDACVKRIRVRTIVSGVTYSDPGDENDFQEDSIISKPRKAQGKKVLGEAASSGSESDLDSGVACSRQSEKQNRRPRVRPPNSSKTSQVEDSDSRSKLTHEKKPNDGDKKAQVFFLSKKQKMELVAQERVERFHKQKSESRKASAEFFRTKDGKAPAVNPFFENVTTSLRAAGQSVGGTSTGTCQTITSTREESAGQVKEMYAGAPFFPLWQHINSPPSMGPSRPVPCAREIPEPILYDDCSCVTSCNSSFDWTRSFHRERLNSVNLRGLWTQYVLAKNSLYLSKTDSPVVSAGCEPEIVDLDTIQASCTGQGVIQQPMSLSALHVSVNTCLVELHKISLMHTLSDRGDCAKPKHGSLLAAQVQLRNWLQHAVVQSEQLEQQAVDKGRNEKKDKGRNNKRYMGDESEAEMSDDDFCPSSRATDNAKGPNVVIIEGRTGCLKTSMVHACAVLCGFTVIEVSVAQDRTGASIKKLVSEASQSQRLKSMSTESCVNSDSPAMNLILFDEVDIVLKEDTAFLNTIHQLSRTSKCPIVMTGESIDPKFLSGFHIEPIHIHVHPPGAVELGRLLWTMGHRSEFTGWVSMQDAVDLATVCGCDVRGCVNALLLVGSMSPFRGGSSNRLPYSGSFSEWLVERGVVGSALDRLCHQDSSVDNIGRQLEETNISSSVTALSQSTLKFSLKDYPTSLTCLSTHKPKETVNGESSECHTKRSLLTPLVTAIEPRRLDVWKGGTIYVHGKNFLQRAVYDVDRSGSVDLAVVVVRIGGKPFTPVVYSDSVLGLAIPPLLTKPAEGLYSTCRVPTRVHTVSVIISTGGVVLSSDVCGAGRAWVSYADSRLPSEIASIAHKPAVLNTTKKGRGGRLKRRSRVSTLNKSSTDCTPKVTVTNESTLSSVCPADSDDDFEDDEMYERQVKLKRRKRDEDGMYKPTSGGEHRRRSRNIITDDEEDEVTTVVPPPCAHVVAVDGAASVENNRSVSVVDVSADCADEQVALTPTHENIDIVSVMKSVLATLVDHPLSESFMYPLDPIEHPTYMQVVNDPMDLSTVVSSVEEALYASLDEFVADIDRIWMNCELWEGDQSQNSQKARTLKKVFHDKLSEILTAPPILQDVVDESGAATLHCEDTRPLRPPPSHGDLAHFLIQAESDRLVSGGNIVNRFVECDDESEKKETEMKFRLSDCFQLPLPNQSLDTDSDLGEINSLVQYLQSGSDADLLEGFVKRQTAGWDDCDDYRSLPLVDESTVLSTCGSSAEDGECADTFEVDSLSDCEVDSFQMIASTITGIALSLVDNRHSLSNNLAPTNFTAKCLLRPRLFNEKMQVVLECVKNVPPNKSASNFPNATTLKRSFLLDVLPELLCMLRAQSGDKCRATTAECGNFLLRRSTRSLTRDTSAGQKFSRVSSLLQQPEALLGKLLKLYDFW